MVETIRDLKDSLLRHIEQETSDRGIQHMDSAMIDMVKDLAMAEKECWEAQYYRDVVEGMEGRSGMGYFEGEMGYSGGQGYGYGGGGGQGYGYGGGNQGYSGGSQGYGYGGGQGYGYGGGQGNSRSGWANQYGSGRMSARRGYGSMGHQNAEEGIRAIMNTSTPEEKERIKQMLKREMGM